MSLPAKHSVAVLIRNGDRVLALRRSDDDDELPGVWGLPAGTCRGSETVEDVIRRVGRDKLGVTLKPIRLLESGSQDRSTYRLEMELWEVTMEEMPAVSEWQWAGFELLQPGEMKGSLCCALALRHKGRAGS